jgi:hypothetical protein
MVFPADNRDNVTELYLNGWVDVTGDVRYQDRVTIARGQSPESTRSQPMTIGFTLSNPDGRYSIRNATGIYYGIIKRNTPVRHLVRKVRDQFARVVASGWGNAPTGATSTSAWTLSGTAAVASGTATHTVAAANSHTITYLNSVSVADADVMVTWSYATADVTGGNLEPGNLVLRMTSTSSYYMARVVVSTAEVITVSIHSFAGGQLVAPVTLGFSHVAGQQVRVRFQAEAQTLRAKVWLASGLEPYDWTVSVHDTTLTAGAVGVRTGAAAGNTNVPATVTYSDFQLLRGRAAGELPELPVEWDTSGQDVFTTVTGGGLLRRLGQGSSPLRSALRRTLPGVSGLVAYWPAEDGRDATGIASGLSDGQIMGLNGTPAFASYTGFKASAALPTANAARWTGSVNSYTNTGALQYRWLMHVPDTGDTDAAVIAAMYTNGTAFLWEVIYLTGGNMKLRAWDSPFNLILDTGALGFSLNGDLVQVSLELSNSGGNVAWTLGVLEVGNPVGGFNSGTLVGYQVGSAVQASINPTADIGLGLSGTAVGHITIQSVITSFFAVASQLKAYVGETAGTRAQRLCLEEGVPFAYIGTLSATSAMGPQGQKSLLDLLDECVQADGASLFEARGHMCLVFRTRESDYNQAATLTLDYASRQVNEPFTPTPDDQKIRNDVTAQRVDGSSYEAQQATGPFKVAEPSAGGVGRYDTTVTVNVQLDAQLPDVAGWGLHLGTVDEERYPGIGVELANQHVVAAGLDDVAMDVDMRHRVVVSNPKAGQAPDAVTQLVSRYVEVLSQRHHKITLACAPESPYQVMQLEVGDLGKLDSDRTTTGASMTSGATSLLLAGEVWSASDVPTDVVVTGERMTVTAVANTVPSFVSVGTVVHADNASLSPGVPAGSVAGDTLVLVSCIRNLSAASSSSGGYTSIANLTSLNIMTKTHSGSESAPTVSFTGGVAGDTTTAFIMAFRNMPSTFYGQSNTFNSGQQNIDYLIIGSTGMANTMAIIVGHKFDDCTSVATLTGFTEAVEATTITGNDQTVVVDYAPYTGDLVIPGGTFTVTGGVAANSRSIVMLFGNPQTATVTRSVNGVVKAHSAGESVSLFRPAYSAW